MRLPPIDALRQPLIVPLGHLVLQAAYLDDDICAFVGLMKGAQVSLENVAQELRNWGQAKDYLEDAISSSIPDDQLADDIREYFGRVSDCRNDRHRMIHDAMDAGIGPDSDGKLQPFVLRAGYLRLEKKRTNRTIVRVSAEDIAALAYKFYDLRLEIDTFMGRWRDISQRSDQQREP